MVDDLMVLCRGRCGRRDRQVHRAFDAEITKAHQKMRAVRSILPTRWDVTRLDASKQDTEREI
jgi:hypothetical protein